MSALQKVMNVSAIPREKFLKLCLKVCCGLGASPCDMSCQPCML